MLYNNAKIYQIYIIIKTIEYIYNYIKKYITLYNQFYKVVLKYNKQIDLKNLNLDIISILLKANRLDT